MSGPKKGCLRIEGKDLVTAIAENNINLVEKLLTAGADVNQISRNGFAPLCIAAFWDSKDIVKMLIKHGADVNVRNNGTKWTPLHCAAFQGHGKVLMQLIMFHNPDLYAEDTSGRTPVDFASTTEKIWGFFAAKDCERTAKKELIAKGIISKVEGPAPTEEQKNDPMSDFAGKTYSSYSRPGSAYVVRNFSAAESRPATAMSNPGSRRNSRPSSRTNSDDGSEELADGMGRMGLDRPDRLDVNKAVHSAQQFGDVLSSMPSPVAEGIENASPSTRAKGNNIGQVYN